MHAGDLNGRWEERRWKNRVVVPFQSPLLRRVANSWNLQIVSTLLMYSRSTCSLEVLMRDSMEALERRLDVKVH